MFFITNSLLFWSNLVLNMFFNTNLGREVKGLTWRFIGTPFGVPLCHRCGTRTPPVPYGCYTARPLHQCHRLSA
uniref:Secreted protein n=1 Tax=Phytophthora fragariae TaxID=53985 RepID=A0A6A3FVJ4_9STRA|nr:hypothetical protein PF009_g1952 [Phytophthora fragariae]